MAVFADERVEWAECAINRAEWAVSVAVLAALPYRCAFLRPVM